MVKLQAKQVNQANQEAIGTGFFLSPTIIATAYHVIEGSEYVYFKDYINDHTRREIIFYLKVLAVDKQYDLALLQIDNEYLDKKLDLALLKSDNELGVNNYDLSLSDRIKKEETVTTIGFSQGSFTEIKGNLINNHELMRIYFSDKSKLSILPTFLNYLASDKKFLPIKIDSIKQIHGTSGSPIFSKEGELLGILVIRSPVIPVIFYTPTERLRSLIRKTSHSASLSAVSKINSCRNNFNK